MNNDERKPRLHINIGLLVIVIIIVLILFKVDIRSKIKSPQFQNNLSFIEEQVKETWQKYVSDPLKEKAGGLFVDITNQSIQKIQDNFTKDVLKMPSDEEIDKIIK